MFLINEYIVFYFERQKIIIGSCDKKSILRKIAYNALNCLKISDESKFSLLTVVAECKELYHQT